MHRAQLLGLLEGYRSSYQEECDNRVRMIAFIEAQPRCFERSLEIGHITGSAWVLNPDHSKVLLTHHKKFNIWLQLGGHCDGESDVLGVALREAHEESGIESITPLSYSIFDIDIHPIPHHKDAVAHYHYDVRFLLQAQDEAYTVSSESNALAWVAKDHVSFFTQENPSLARMFEKWVKLVG
jgi:8-oxo-dGTP pyrophosphatase MutT (NUDIX family)